jgi:hypothetical protein
MSKKLTKKAAIVALTLMTVVSLSGVPVASAQTVEDLQAQITALLAQITALQQQLAGVGSSGGTTACNFTRNLTVGSTGEDVRCLQQFLNGAGHTLATSGAGSPGNETTYFGSITRGGVIAWQNANSAQVLAPVNLSAGTGFWGPSSIAHYKTVAGSTPTPTPPGTPPPPSVPGSGLSVALSGNQPTPGLFGENFASLPFTNVVFTASFDGEVTINSMTVRRTGQGNDAAFNGVIPIDENGFRIGTAKTFGSDHTLKLTKKIVVKAGQSRTITIAGDSDADQNDYNGQLVSLTLDAVDAGSATVTGIPSGGLKGTTHTVNSTLAIGTLTMERGGLDPGAGVTKEVGTKGYTFAGLKFTVGSNEKVLFKSMKWNQTGSASASDLANCKIVVDGEEFDAHATDDSDYFQASFGSGIVRDKGAVVETSIKCDIVSGSNRGIDFDLERAEDLRAEGETFGYGITPTFTNSGDSATDDDGTIQTAEPQFDAYETTIGAGSVTIETASQDVPAQNIAENVGDQPLGGYKVTVKGEAVTVAKTVINFNSSGTGSVTDIDQIKIVRNDGVVVAGPVDPSTTAATFSDTIEYPLGTTVYTLKGKPSTTFANNDTIVASTTPNTDWTTVRGVDTNTTITLSSSIIVGQTMTVKAGALEVSTSPTPVAQTVVAGTPAFNFANFTFDATASGEDVKVPTIQVEYNFGQANSNDDLSTCQLWDGAKALNTGTNVVDGANSDTTGGDKTFTLDTPLVIPKGTIKTIGLKCNTTATTTATVASYNWTIDIPGDADDMIPTGVTSGTTITETYSDTTGQQITLTRGGSFSVAKEESTSSATNSPQLAISNTTGNILNTLKFIGNNEEIRVDQVGITLRGPETGSAYPGVDNSAASSTPQDVALVTLWDGATKVGTAVFTGDYATVTLAGFIIPKDGEKTLTIKADLAKIGTSDPGRPGHQVRITHDTSAADASGSATKGIGLSSGRTVYATPVSSAVRPVSGGVRVFKAVPTLARIPLDATQLKLVNGTRTLYRFSVTAPSGGNGVGLYQFTYGVSTSTSGVTTFKVDNFQVYGYSDPGFSNPAYANGGLLNSTNIGDNNSTGHFFEETDTYYFRFNPNNPTSGTAAAIQVPAGSTRYFELKGSVSNSSATSSSVVVELAGDASYLYATSSADGTANDNWIGSSAGIGYTFATTAAQVASTTEHNAYFNTVHNDFIWSGNSTTTSGVAHYDWINGYQVPGLPSTSMTPETLTP